MNKDEYVKHFDKWNDLKKCINNKDLPPDFFFVERDIWWASIGINVAEEIDGKNEYFERPILIIKKLSENTLLSLPFTKTERRGESFHKTFGNGGNFICLSQLRFISAKRLLKFIRVMGTKEFESIRNKLCELLSTKRNPPSARRISD